MLLAEVLEIPDPFITASQNRFCTLEAPCLFCACFKTAGDQGELMMNYNWNQSVISEVVTELIEFLDENWKHLPDINHQCLLSSDNLAHYAKAIYEADS